MQVLFGFLSLFAALCTIFALVVTAEEAWREHAQLSWPSATASIQHCRVDTYRRSRSGALGERSRIACDIQYSVNDNDVQAYIHSSSSSSVASPVRAARLKDGFGTEAFGEEIFFVMDG